MRIQHNIMAMNAYRNYNTNTSALSKNLEKLSSGYRINRAGDDAAGLAISEKMRAQITGLDAAQKNVKDGISLVKTAEGAMQEIQDMLNRMKYLATQSANGTYQDDVDREALQDEVDALTQEIDRIAQSANFNGQKLLDGSLNVSGTGTGTFGTTSVTFSVAGLETADTDPVNGDGNGANYSGNDTAITVAFADGSSVAAGTINVSHTNNALTITLGTDGAAATYTAEQITQAVRDYALNSGDADAIKSYGGFTMTSDDITLTADATTAMSAVTLADVAGFGNGLNLQIGDDGNSYNQLTVQIDSMRSSALGVDQVSVANIADAQAAVDSIVDIINSVSSTRGQLGAIQNRLEHTQNNLSVMEENIQDAESTIRDTDVADEMMAYTKNNILVQSAQAMLAQANAVPQGVLQLMQ